MPQGSHHELSDRRRGDYFCSGRAGDANRSSTPSPYPDAMRSRDLLFQTGLIGLFVGGVWAALPPSSGMSSEERQRIETSVYYAGCNEVRAAGKAPLRAGEPGYREGMDGDGDGLACEPISSRRESGARLPFLSRHRMG